MWNLAVYLFIYNIIMLEDWKDRTALSTTCETTIRSQISSLLSWAKAPQRWSQVVMKRKYNAHNLFILILQAQNRAQAVGTKLHESQKIKQ